MDEFDNDYANIFMNDAEIDEFTGFIKTLSIPSICTMTIYVVQENGKWFLDEYRHARVYQCEMFRNLTAEEIAPRYVCPVIGGEK